MRFGKVPQLDGSPAQCSPRVRGTQRAANPPVSGVSCPDCVQAGHGVSPSTPQAAECYDGQDQAVFSKGDDCGLWRASPTMLGFSYCSGTNLFGWTELSFLRSQDSGLFIRCMVSEMGLHASWYLGRILLHHARCPCVRSLSGEPLIVKHHSDCDRRSWYWSLNVLKYDQCQKLGLCLGAVVTMKLDWWRHP